MGRGALEQCIQGIGPYFRESVMPVLFDSNNPRAVMVHAWMQQFLDPSQLVESPYLVIGGDGFMLQAVRQHYAPDRVFLGLNCGRLGFLLNDLPTHMESLPTLLAGALRVMTFPRIHMQAVDVHGHVFEADALNDIYLERMTGQTCHLKLQIDARVVVHELVCDGLICCTALGSTAYSFSAGGSPCHPSMEIIGITPICPHVPRLTPMIFPLNAKVEISVLNCEKRKVRVAADGVDFNDIVHLTVSNASSPVRLAYFQEHDFTSMLVAKVLHV